MSEHNIEVESGKSLRLKTAGKYCDRDIVVSATGGGGDTDAAYQEGLTAGIEQGKQAEYDSFWDAFQQNGNRTDYKYGFHGWTDGCFKPKYDLIPTNAAYMFYYCDVTDLKGLLNNAGVALDFSEATLGTTDLFAYCKTRTIPVVNLSHVTTLMKTFQWCQVETIDELHVNENMIFTNTFQNTSNLKDITIVGTIGNTIDFRHCSQLSNASVQSIIDALKDLTGATTIKVQFHATVGAKLTEAQKAAITAKNWTLVC